MTQRTEFEFVTAAACRDARAENCPEVALNVPEVVALRDSQRPDTIVTMTPADWATLTAAIKGGEFDLSVPERRSPCASAPGALLSA